MSPYLRNLNQLGALSSAELHKVIQHIEDINEFLVPKHYTHKGRLRLAPHDTHGWLEGLRSFSFHSLGLQCPVTPFPCQKERGVHKCLHEDGYPGEKRAHLSPVPHWQ